MKKFFKKYAMVLVALVIASGTLMSFELDKTSNIDSQWFKLIGDDPYAPQDYELFGPQPDDCNLGQEVCVIQAEVDSHEKPVLTNDLETEIASALSSATPSSNVRLMQ